MQPLVSTLHETQQDQRGKLSTKKAIFNFSANCQHYVSDTALIHKIPHK